MSLITTILNPPDDGQSLHKYKKARKKRKNKGRKLAESAKRGRQPLQSVYNHYYTRIGELFFLKQRYLCMKIRSSPKIPDIRYLCCLELTIFRI